MDREQALLQITENEYPGFSVKMEPSHVSYFFFAEFCNSYMPEEDENVILVDDEGQETVTKYLAKQHGLSAGWRRFAKDHGLSEEDYLVFRRIATAPYKFKVEIYRKSCPETTAAEVLVNGFT